MSDLFDKSIIDKNSAIPLYFQLYTYIKTCIDENEIVNGDHLPTEDDLTFRLGISRPTIRQAYKELESKGYVRRQRSKGTVVTKPKVYDKFLSTLVSFRNELEMRGDVVITKVLDLKVIENHDLPSEILQSNKLVFLRRARYSGKTPISYIESYLLYDRCKELLQYDFEKDSLYARMKELGYPIVSVKRIIGTEECNKETAKWLKMRTKDTILISRTTGRSEDGTNVEYTLDRYNGAISNFQVELEMNAKG